MFEGYASELLASYLGHFFDVKKEQLRISLWSGKPRNTDSETNLAISTPDKLANCCSVVDGRLYTFCNKFEMFRALLWKRFSRQRCRWDAGDAAWSTGVVLTDLKLKTEAFDNLQLPFAIQEGRLGRLEVQV